jgi:hypothetical protein
MIFNAQNPNGFGFVQNSTSAVTLYNRIEVDLLD